jgi:hypothetical protein
LQPTSKKQKPNVRVNQKNETKTETPKKNDFCGVGVGGANADEAIRVGAD